MTYKNSGEIDNNSSDSIFGIAIRLSFSLRNQEDSSYALFFNTTFPKIRGKAEYEITIFPTNLKIQEKYRAMLNRVLFFTPDFSSIYEGTIYNILDKQDQLDIISNPGCDPYLYKNLILPDSAYLSRFIKLKKHKANWIVIENLREIELKDIQQYYVYGTNYSLADKMMEPAFPRIYYTNTEKHRFHEKRNFLFCPYCGHSLSEDFLYCPSCGSSLRIINNQ